MKEKETCQNCIGETFPGFELSIEANFNLECDRCKYRKQEANSKNEWVSFYCFKNTEVPREEYTKLINKIVREYLHPADKTIANYLQYTLQHKMAIMALSYEYLGYVSKRIMLHDIEKLVLYTMMDKKDASKLHRQYSIHHHTNFKLYGNEIENRMEAVLDYECARYTKNDKPENAYLTIELHHPEDMAATTSILNRFNINSSENHDSTFTKWNQVAFVYLPIFKSTMVNSIENLKEAFKTGNIDRQVDLFNIYLSKCAL